MEYLLTVIPLMRASRYYGLLILARTKALSVIFFFRLHNFFKTAAPVIWRQIFFGALVTGLTKLHGGTTFNTDLL